MEVSKPGYLILILSSMAIMVLLYLLLDSNIDYNELLKGSRISVSNDVSQGSEIKVQVTNTSHLILDEMEVTLKYTKRDSTRDEIIFTLYQVLPVDSDNTDGSIQVKIIDSKD